MKGETELFPSIHSRYPLTLCVVRVGLEPIPVVITQEAGYTLDRSPVMITVFLHIKLIQISEISLNRAWFDFFFKRSSYLDLIIATCEGKQWHKHFLKTSSNPVPEKGTSLIICGDIFGSSKQCLQCFEWLILYLFYRYHILSTQLWIVALFVGYRQLWWKANIAVNKTWEFWMIRLGTNCCVIPRILQDCKKLHEIQHKKINTFHLTAIIWSKYVDFCSAMCWKCKKTKNNVIDLFL